MYSKNNFDFFLVEVGFSFARGYYHNRDGKDDLISYLIIPYEKKGGKHMNINLLLLSLLFNMTIVINMKVVFTNTRRK